MRDSNSSDARFFSLSPASDVQAAPALIAMKSLILLALLTVLSLGRANEVLIRRARGTSLSDVVNAVACAPKLPSVIEECDREMDDRVRALKEVDVAGDASTCCYFAAFRQCVRTRGDIVCGKDTSSLLDTAIGAVQGTIMNKCSDFEYMTPSCLFVLYYPWLVLAGVLFFLIGIGWCLGACCCR